MAMMTLEKRIESASIALFGESPAAWAAEDEQTRSYYRKEATSAIKAAFPEFFIIEGPPYATITWTSEEQ